MTLQQREPSRLARALRASVHVHDATVPMRDGYTTAADVTLVDGSPRPVLLIRSPYSRAAMRLAHDPVHLAREGWAVVVQDVRGRFDSDGEFEPFVQEVADGYDTVEWCSRQPWSDGRVVMAGVSYVGYTQWAAAVTRHPALHGIVPMLAAGDLNPEWMHEGGAFQLGMVQPWAVNLAATSPGVTAELRNLIGWVASQWQEIFNLPLSQDPVPHLFAPYRSWRDARPLAGWVTGREIAHVTAHVFQVAGWYDIFCESALRHHAALAARLPVNGRAPRQRLVVGPWSHTDRLTGQYPEFDFGGSANGGFRDLPGEALRWLRAALDGEDAVNGVSCYVMGSHEWRELESWPPPARPVRLHLSSGLAGANSSHGDGVLTLSPADVVGEDRYVYDPSRPVPTRGGRILGPYLPMAGPVDQRPVEERRDVLVYTGEAVRDTVTVIGEVHAQLLVESSAPSADFTVKLCDVHPDGRVFNIIDSVTRTPLAPGQPTPIRVAVGSTAHAYLPEHRVRVEISSSNFPRLDRNPSTGEDPATASVLIPAAQRLWWGGSTGTTITLPVVTS